MTRNPIRIQALDHVVLRVRDLARSIEFYENVLGCVVERRLEDLGLVQLRAGGSLIDLVGVDTALGRAGGDEPARQGPNLDHFAVALDAFDIPAIRAHLSAHGIANDEPERRYGAAGFGPSIYIEDPDGNTVELKGPPDPESSESASDGA